MNTLCLSSGELPFQCNFCEKKFAQKNDMYKHETAMHWKKLRCSTCSLQFTSQAECKEHRAKCSKVSPVAEPNLKGPAEKEVSDPLSVEFTSSVVLEQNFDNNSEIILPELNNATSLIQGVSDVQFHCTGCDVTFDTEQRLEKHFRGFHGQNNLEESTVEAYHLEYAV